MKTRPLIAISACLLGENVRYNGGNTKDNWIVNDLSKFVDFYPLCPEIEMKLGIPREEIQLISDKKNISLVTKNTKVNLNEKAFSAYNNIHKQLEARGIDGFILMKKSPSCGVGSAKVYKKDSNDFIGTTHGFFASYVEKQFPLIPKIDSGRMRDFQYREHFIKMVYAYFRLKKVSANIGSLQKFHESYKYILMEHSAENLKKLGQIVANSNNKKKLDVFENYKKLFLHTLTLKPSTGNRYNTLNHVMGYFKKILTSEDKQNLLSLLNSYKLGVHNYMVPLNLLSFFSTKYQINYLKNQYYFKPYPLDLKLHKEL